MMFNQSLESPVNEGKSMFATTISRLRAFLFSWPNFVALALLPVLGFWIYSRVAAVNPAILGDEYLYSMNARHSDLWGPLFSGDYSNYLFNVVYSGTSLCGDSFYSCAKGLNVLFFLGFVFILFSLAQRYMPSWAALFFMVSAALSPLSVYTSMFLPESMFFFAIGVVLIVTHRAMLSFNTRQLAAVGVALGVASLIKPHAWLAFVPIFITLTVIGLTSGKSSTKKMFAGLSALTIATGASRLIIGLLVAGPKSIGLFGSYVNSTTLPDLVAQGAPSDTSIESPSSIMLALFPEQFAIHAYVVIAILGVSLIGIALGLLEIIRTRNLSGQSALALLSFIWLVALMIEIVLFTGWVTSTGDDHSGRVLLRYYEYLFLIVPLAGLSVLFTKRSSPPNYFVRWPIAIVFIALATPAFTGVFAELVIQIADAPTLAGLIVNFQTMNLMALLSFGGILIFAVAPKLTKYALISSLTVSMVWTGWNIQSQYIGFRGTLSAEDSTGLLVRSKLSDLAAENVLVVADSRFKATNLAFWVDSDTVSYKLFVANASVLGDDLGNADVVVTPRDFIILDGFQERSLTEEYDLWVRDSHS